MNISYEKGELISLCAAFNVDIQLIPTFGMAIGLQQLWENSAYFYVIAEELR
jgi:hypothetical protein